MKKYSSLYLKIFLVIICFTFSYNSFSNRERIIDSLRKAAESGHDTLRVQTLNKLSMEYSSQTYYILAEKAAMNALEIAQKINYVNGIGNACYYIGISYARRTKYDQAAEWYFRARENFEKAGNKSGLAYTIMLHGVLDYFQKKNNSAEENYTKALKIFESIKDTLGMANCLVNLGSLQYAKENYQDAIILSEKAYAMFGRSLHGKAVARSTIGFIYSDLFLKNDSSGNKEAAKVYFNKAIDIYNDNLKVYKQLNQKNEVALQYINLNKIYFNAANLNFSKLYLDSAYSLIKESDNYKNLSLLYKDYYEWYKSTGDIKQALDNYILYTAANDSIHNVNQAEKMEALNVQLAELEKQKQIEDLNKEKEKQKIYLWSTLLIAFLGVALSILFFYRFREKKLSNYVLAEKSKVIEEKNKEITDSINYAKRIQQALLLPEEALKKYFPEVFVIFLPKDIVSGDFYWFAESEKNKIIAVADCTGHGVPGGFMSMMGYEMLQDVLLKEDITTTDAALKTLDIRITETLNKTGKNFRDGMDMALCAFSKSGNSMLYSGANRPLLHFSGEKLIEYNPDKNTLGGDVDGYEKKYSMQKIVFEKGDMFYMFSDGYADQFGGPKSKKFMYKNLKALITKIHHLETGAQKKELLAEFEKWKGSIEQVDDVCIIGIRV